MVTLTLVFGHWQASGLGSVCVWTRVLVPLGA